MKRLVFLAVSLVIVAVWVARAGQTALQVPASQIPPQAQAAITQLKSGQKKWPPLFPNPSSKKVFEDERVIVWDETLTDHDYVHKHLRDSISVYVQDDGDLRSINAKGEVSIGKVGTRYMGAEVPHTGSGSKAGLGPHSTAAVDPKKGTRRIFWIEFKGTEPPDCKEWSTAC